MQMITNLMLFIIYSQVTSDMKTINKLSNLSRKPALIMVSSLEQISKTTQHIFIFWGASISVNIFLKK